jgi:hypothetical protein
MSPYIAFSAARQCISAAKTKVLGRAAIRGRYPDPDERHTALDKFIDEQLLAFN